MLTRRGIGLLVAAGVLWLASRSFGIAELQLAAVASLVLVVLALLMVLVGAGRLRVERALRPHVLEFGAEGEVTLTVTNEGVLPTLTLDMRDLVPAALGGDHHLTVRPIGPAEHRTMTYRITGHQRGRMQVGPCELTALDPFGLAARTRRLGASTAVTVYPQVWELVPGMPLGGTASSIGDGRRRLTPGGEDLADIREYVRGDDLRTVHWPSTAHRGRLMVRQSESAETPRAVIVLDVRADMHRGIGPDATIETAVSAAASVGHHLVSRGRAVTLLDEPIVAAATPSPWDQWLDRLADITPRDVDLAGLLRQIGLGVAGDGTLVAIQTIPDAGQLRAMVRAGRGFSTRIGLLVDTTGHSDEPTGRGLQHHDPQRGRTPAGLDANGAAAALAAAGWRVTVVRPGDRIDAAWQRLVTQRRQGGAA